ncbi:oxidoreductase [Magnetofaba australis]|nr:oxidoreductase [Magnetofaba australis]
MALLPKPESRTVTAIYHAYESAADDGFRPHLGASLIGKECERALWYDFHWVTRSQFAGRILRLFQTGHLEEPRLVADLRRIGVTVMDLNPQSGRQWQVKAHGGHFGGSLDAVAMGVPEAPKTWHVCEFKTHNAKSFKALVDKGVEEAKPQHYAQMQIYMHLFEMERALYLSVCKDSEELYAERVCVDHDLAQRLLEKAGRIIFSPHPPVRLHEDPSWWQCKLCDHHAICHEGAFAEINCRTCLHSTAEADGRWSCAQHQIVLSAPAQKQGCNQHLYIPDLVPGKQTDVDPVAGVVTYQFPGGGLWRNGSEGSQCGAPAVDTLNEKEA